MQRTLGPKYLAAWRRFLSFRGLVQLDYLLPTMGTYVDGTMGRHDRGNDVRDEE